MPFRYNFFLLRRGCENLRQQTKQTFSIAVDSTQRKYVYQAVDELDKNHRGSDNQQDSVTVARMYEQPGNLLCPVRCFELYLSKLNPGLNSLWQRPKQMAMEDENIWYDKVPVGKNTLGLFIKKLSKSAELSKEYTNHCIRATAVIVLDKNNFEERHILRVLKHKSEANIRSYSRRLSEEKQIDISNSLSHYCGFPSNTTSDIRSVPDSESEPAAKVPRLVTESSSSCIEISLQEYQSALDTLLHMSPPPPPPPVALFVSSGFACSEKLLAKKHYEERDCFVSTWSI